MRTTELVLDPAFYGPAPIEVGPLVSHAPNLSAQGAYAGITTPSNLTSPDSLAARDIANLSSPNNLVPTSIESLPTERLVSPAQAARIALDAVRSWIGWRRGERGRKPRTA
jgi:hypothetical protein